MVRKDKAGTHVENNLACVLLTSALVDKSQLLRNYSKPKPIMYYVHKHNDKNFKYFTISNI